MLQFSNPADCRRAGVTLLLTACMCYPVMLSATEADLSVRSTVAGTAPVPQASVAEGAASQQDTPQENTSATGAFAEVAAPAEGEQSAAVELESSSEEEVVQSEIGGADELEMPIVEPATPENLDESEDAVADAAASAELSEQATDSLSKSQSPRELSVAPGDDPLLPEDAPSWVGATPQLDGEIHTLVVSSMPTAKRSRVDAELDMPLRKTVMDYVKHDLADDTQDVDLRSYITADYIRKNLIDSPEGYIAEIATSNGPMYQKWVKVNVTPEQQKQLNSWYVEAVQAKRLPPIGYGLAGLLGVIGLSHLMLRRKHPHAAQPVHVDPTTQPAPANHRGVLGTLVGLGLLGSGVIAIGLFASLAGVRSRQVVEIEKMHADQVRASAMQEVERARAEAASALDRLHSDSPSFANPSDLFGTPEGLAPQPPSAPATPPPARDSSSVELPNGSMTTTINSNGNQQIIIRTRSR